ncbi:MAG: hypothetical protein HUJ52_03695, partial [Malacoplasma sp.]|nr:hypothetical protein [Malacoplasma sp.]
QVLNITPTKAGPFTLALDFTLVDGTTFTASTTVVVTSNYPWTVTVGENCKADASTKRVEILDVTKDATINVSAAEVPSTAEYIVHAFNQDEQIIELELKDGVLTIPKDTFKVTDKEPFIVCSISIKNGDHYIGSTMYMNITMQKIEPVVDQGTVTFVDWTNENKTGVMDYLDEPHTQTDIPDVYIVPINVPTEINSFIYKYVKAETVAEGVMQRAYELLQNYHLKDSIVNWKTITDVTESTITFVIAASFTVDYIDAEGVHSDKTLVFNQKLIKDTTVGAEKVASFEVTEETLMNGEITNIYNDSGTEILALLNGQDPESSYMNGPYLAIPFMGSSGVLPYLYLSLNEFNGGMGLASIGSYIFYSEDMLTSHASKANFPVKSDWGKITIKSASLKSDSNNLLSKTYAGIFADGLAQDGIDAVNLIKSYGITVSSVQGYTIWSYATNVLAVKIVVFIFTKEMGLFPYQKALTFTINNDKVTTLSAVWTKIEAGEYGEGEFDVSATGDFQTVTKVMSESELIGYDINLKNSSNQTTNIRIPYKDYGPDHLDLE